LPKKWPETFHALIDQGRALGRSRSDLLVFEFALLGYSTVTNRSERALTLEVAAQLYRDSGLDLIAELAPEVPPSELLHRALTAAQQRYDALPPEERGLPLFEAIQTLAQVVIQAIGTASRTFDRALLCALPTLTPLAPLSPALAVVQCNLETSIDLMSGRSDRARRSYLDILERLAAPDGAGLSGSHLTHMRLAMLWAIGSIEANAGRSRACARADALGTEPLFVVSALRLRAIHALFQGDRRSAEAHRTQTELLQIRNAPPQILEGSQAFQWTMGYAAIGDLLRVKQCLNDVEAMAREHSGWQPIVHYGRGAYQTLRGDHVHALAEYDRSLALAAPGHHLVWVWSTAAMVWSLVHQQRFDDALVRGQAALAEFERNDLMPTAHAVLVPLSLAEGSLGRFAGALEHIHAAIEQLRSDGGSGVQLGVAYEVRARIAIQQSDTASFVQYAGACEAQFRIGAHSALLARHEKLMRTARKAGLIEDLLSDAVDETQQSSAEDVRSTVFTVLSTAQGPEQRAERALMLLGRFSRCDTGYLYMLQRQGPVLVAQLGAVPPRLDMDEFVTRYLVDALDERDVTQTEASEALEPKPLWTATESSRFSPMLLSHTGERGRSITGVAVMYVQASASFRVPARLLQALSRALYEAGDAITQLGHELDDELPPEA
jgi:hypothetical protein